MTTLTTNGLTGKQWIKRFKDNGYNISHWAKEIILSPEFEKSRLPKGTEIHIELVKGADVSEPRTTDAIKNLARGKGWQVPTPEVALLIREAVSDEEMEQLGIWYIATLHDPIEDSDGSPGVLSAFRLDGGRWVYASWASPGRQWDTIGAFAFSVPASASDSETTHSSDPLNLAARVQRLEEVIKHHNLGL